MKILKQSRLVEVQRFHLCFDYLDSPGAGYGFDCDAEGHPIMDAMSPTAQANYVACLSGRVGDSPVGPGHVDDVSYSYKEPAVGRCTCGVEVELGEFTNACGSCGGDYNWAGQELGPREDWGAETGEHWTECIGPFSDERE